jgi:transcriptional regulator with XRE-family HTH domain/tetratricopeptide (TPR) repeat protein
MPSELGAWLREQREIRGWVRLEMARRLVKAGQAAGDRSMPSLESMCHNVYRWERGTDNPSERYRLYYSHALGMTPDESSLGQHGAASHLTQAPATMTWPPQSWPLGAWGPAVTQGRTPNQVHPSPQESAAIAYLGIKESIMGDSAVQQEVFMAAHEGSDHAEEFEQHGIGEATFEQLRADVMRLSRLCDTDAPLPAFMDMRRVRNRIYRLLERRLWPREQVDLFFLLGCLNGLMGVTANRLGYPDAAEELIRSGWAHANAIDHRPLLAKLRSELSYVEYWRGRTRQSRDLAASGLDYLAEGPAGGELHLQLARTAAKLGDVDTARQAVSDAHDARDHDHSDELLEIGGEFAISQAWHHALAGSALAEVPGAEQAAVAELERAISLYDAGPESGEAHWFGGRAHASIDLGIVRLRAGGLDAAIAALEAVFSLPPALRISSVTDQLNLVSTELAAPIFRGAVQARNLDERIEDFGLQAITVETHGLVGGLG